MKIINRYYTLKAISSLFFMLFTCAAYAQTITGKVLDELHEPLEGVEVSDGTNTVLTDRNGNYNLPVSPDEEVEITFNRFDRNPFSETVSLSAGTTKEIFVALSQVTVLDGVEIISFQNEKPINSVSLSPADITAGPSLTGSYTDILKTLPYVNSNTELSSQYMVRGGNYDENLVYVNGIEIYRPQLIRSGQQEGLGFVNPDMAQALNFSAGGWEAKYGDKMSSVMDVIYKTPRRFEGSMEVSLMGGNLTLGTVSEDKKFSVIGGARYQNRNLILNTMDEDTDFNPIYYDFQTFMTYKFDNRWSLSFLGSFSKSRFEMRPNTRESTFQTAEQELRLNVFYDGRENDEFQTETGALSLNFKASEKLNLTVDVFAYHSKESEYFDIHGEYLISELDGEGNATQTYDIGGQIDHARNNFDALVAGIQHRGKYLLDPNSDIEWGVKIQQEDIRDLMNEWRLLDSTGYSLPIPTNGNLVLDYNVDTRNFIKSNRFSGYAQYTKKFKWNETRVLFNAGARVTYWDFNNETNISPRAQIAFKPNWRRDMLFRFSTGLYYQPPFYREIRRLDGTINNEVKSQQSIHFIAGNDYEFQMMNRPFKLTTEIYYKLFNDLNPYFIDNVRVRYQAHNDSDGYAYGIDMRLNGEFVPGVESWFSLSYARAYQDIEGRGNIPLPTDPRFKASLFFQDYMPMFPSFKVNVNLIYASGLPNGAPQYADPYQLTSYLDDYMRADIGFVKEFINEKDLKSNKPFWGKFRELSLGLDVFNIFDIRNEISTSWIRDVNSFAVYSIPNRLTGRFLNLKLRMKF